MLARLAVFIAAFLQALEAIEPWTDADLPATPAATTCEAGIENSGGSCHYAMIQWKSSQSRTQPALSAHFGGESLLGSTATLDNEGLRSILGLHSRHQVANFVRRLAKEMDMKIVKEDDFREYVASVDNQQDVNTLRGTLEYQSSQPCGWVTRRNQALHVNGGNAPLTEDGYIQVAAMRNSFEMFRLARRVIESEGFFLADKGALEGMLGYYTCEKGVQSLDKMREELRGVAASDNGWVTIAGAPSLAQIKSNKVSFLTISQKVKRLSDDPLGIGTTAPLDEVGYKEVANTKSNIEMSIFVLRVVRQHGMQVVDEDQFSGLIPYYSGDKSVQTFDTLEQEIQKITKAMCAWIIPDTETSNTDGEVDGKSVPLTEQGYYTIAKLRSPLDMRDFILRVIKDMDMTVVEKGGLMGFLPFHDCEHGAKTLKDMKEELQDAAKKKTWLRYLDASEIMPGRHATSSQDKETSESTEEDDSHRSDESSSHHVSKAESMEGADADDEESKSGSSHRSEISEKEDGETESDHHTSNDEKDSSSTRDANVESSHGESQDSTDRKEEETDLRSADSSKDAESDKEKEQETDGSRSYAEGSDAEGSDLASPQAQHAMARGEEVASSEEEEEESSHSRESGKDEEDEFSDSSKPSKNQDSSDSSKARVHLEEESSSASDEETPNADHSSSARRSVEASEGEARSISHQKDTYPNGQNSISEARGVHSQASKEEQPPMFEPEHISEEDEDVSEEDEKDELLKETDSRGHENEDVSKTLDRSSKKQPETSREASLQEGESDTEVVKSKKASTAKLSGEKNSSKLQDVSDTDDSGSKVDARSESHKKEDASQTRVERLQGHGESNVSSDLHSKDNRSSLLRELVQNVSSDLHSKDNRSSLIRELVQNLNMVKERKTKARQRRAVKKAKKRQ
jgi:hypothetical protein